MSEVIDETIKSLHKRIDLEKQSVELSLGRIKEAEASMIDCQELILQLESMRKTRKRVP